MSWALVPTFACCTSFAAYNALPRGALFSAATCCTRSAKVSWRSVRFCLFKFCESAQSLVGKWGDAEACTRGRVVVVREAKEVGARLAAVEFPCLSLHFRPVPV